jgi:hypothetical protein
MDAQSLEYITSLAQAVTADIRQWSDSRIQQLVADEKQLIEIEAQKQVEDNTSRRLAKHLRESKKLVRAYRTFFFWMGIHLSKAAPALGMIAFCTIFCTIFGISVGLFLGLNVVPTTVGCSSRNSLCYNWRLNKDTTVVPKD